jgi:hypothetical protein
VSCVEWSALAPRGASSAAARDVRWLLVAVHGDGAQQQQQQQHSR